MSDKKMVKVKILAYVGAYVPNQVVEVDEEFAAHLCHVNELDDGVTKVRHVRAMRLEDAEAMEAAAGDISTMTAAEAAAAGKKNVVDSSGKSEEEKAAADLKAQAEAELAAEEKAAKKGKK